MLTADAFDFMGNLERSTRTLADDYRKTYDWTHDAVSSSWQRFVTTTAYDALGRPVTITTPDGSIHHPVFNAANLLTSLDVNIRAASLPVPFVTSIDYDAAGRRVMVSYGNGVNTRYRYDPLTFRVAEIETIRAADHAGLQHLSYVYDPVGNVVAIEDAAQQTIYFDNQAVAPGNAYAYDALYRLIEAGGREHIGQASRPETTWNDEFRVRLHHPQDGQAMRLYTERYEYDPAGNFERVVHQAVNGSWTRTYSYDETSLLEPGKTNNRLSGTRVGANSPEHYGYDAHGSMTSLPHLTLMQWDIHDRLAATATQAMSTGTPETTYYVYDAAGRRVRKVTERQNGTRATERIYVGGFEVYREYAGSGAAVTLERQTVQVMDRDQRLALVETRTQGTEPDVPAQLVRFQFGDHLGSAGLELDEQARIISYEEYYAYGSTSYQAGAIIGEVALKRYRHIGVERDQESGLGYHGARYYASWLGRWISCDPSGLAGGINLYCYSSSSPVTLFDPDGRDPLLFPINEESQRKMWRGKPLPATQTLPPPGKSKRGKGSGQGATKKPASPSQQPGKQGGLEGGVGTAQSTATKYATGKYVEEGAGDGQGGLGDPGDVGSGSDTGQGTLTTATPGNSSPKTDPGTPTSPGGVPGGNGQPGGKKGGAPEGSPGSGGDSHGDPSSILDDLAALASLVEDPESLYNAKHSGNKGKGSQFGSQSGFLSGWFAQILIIGMAVWDYAGNYVKKGLNKLKEGLDWAKGKLHLSGSPEPRLLPETTGPTVETPPESLGDPYRDPGRPYQEELPKETPSETVTPEQPAAKTEAEIEAERLKEQEDIAAQRLYDWEKWNK